MSLSFVFCLLLSINYNHLSCTNRKDLRYSTLEFLVGLCSSNKNTNNSNSNSNSKLDNNIICTSIMSSWFLRCLQMVSGSTHRYISIHTYSMLSYLMCFFYFLVFLKVYYFIILHVLKRHLHISFFFSSLYFTLNKLYYI